MKTITTLAACALTMAATDSTLRADTFGNGVNTFTVAFVPISSAGNGADSLTGYGAVPYNYNISTYAISQTQINVVTALGVAGLGGGAFTGSQPAAFQYWYQAAAFVNWLNTSQGYTAAYNLTYDSGNFSLALWSPAQAWQFGGQNLYRNASAHYFLPSENEYYKAAYYDPNKESGAGYWLYATGSNAAPTPVASGTVTGTAVYSTDSPAAVDSAGGLSPYGTMGQSGNVAEWMESSSAGDNSFSSETRAERGGNYYESANALQATQRYAADPGGANGAYLGFRVASVPEPASAVLLLGGGAFLAIRRRRALRICGLPSSNSNDRNA